MAEITRTQGRYLAYIRAYTEGFGLPPAEAEIAAALGVAPPSAHLMVKTLERKGFIRRQPGVPRSIEILVSRDAIPTWTGKRVSRTVWEWTPVRPAASRSSQPRGTRLVPAPAANDATVIYRLKIVLRGTVPAIWRRIETPDVSLAKLHALIQTAMGWTNSHLHQFEFGGRRYVDPRLSDDDADAIDYSDVRLSNLVALKRGSRLRMLYEYDFGDGWQHEIVLEKAGASERGVKYPRCLEGERACPPEDIGGVYGFADYVAAIADPRHSRHDASLEWHGPFDPARFDAATATRRMRKGLPEW